MGLSRRTRCGEGEESRRRKMDLVTSRLGRLVARKKIGKPLDERQAELPP